jgi:hypothetical protein
MQKLLFSFFLLTIFSSDKEVKTLKSTWEYCGGIFNNKLSPAPKDYTQQRKYTAKTFEAFLLEKGEKPMKYESGNYTLNGDSCIEIQTYSMQESKLLNIAVHYQYSIRNDTLILKGKLPSGAVIEDYWKKVK